MSANDRLFDELLRPIVDEFYEACRTLADASDTAETVVARAVLLCRMNLLEEVGTRTARVLEVTEPLWEEMRGLAGLPW